MPQSLASIPYGQYKQGELTDEDVERVGTFWKSYWAESIRAKQTPTASRYPSFEMWAAMTSYDRDAEDGTGGDGFQNLMRLLLCGVTHASTTQVQNVSSKTTAYISRNYADELYWDSETGEYGRMFKTGYDFGKVPPDAWYHDDEYEMNGEPSSTHASAHCRPFVPTEDKPEQRGVYWGAVTKGGGTLLNQNFGTKFGYYPCSAMDFLVKTNMKVLAAGAQGVNNVGQAYKNVGVGPNMLEDCWEIAKLPEGSEPCMLTRNKIAAYFGLYYYADCRHEWLNWKVYERIDGRIYEIQMRCPNPKYGKPGWYTDSTSPFERDKLFVREPLNPVNKRSLEGHQPPSKSYKTIVQNDPTASHSGTNATLTTWVGRTQATTPTSPKASSRFHVLINRPRVTHTHPGVRWLTKMDSHWCSRCGFRGWRTSGIHCKEQAKRPFSTTSTCANSRSGLWER